ncbi:hypothetical protein ABZW03_09710 [Kitasatospora sp. NPDC004799]|uniref:hypothetical protein n=1 Tax=Kitasatospora sp. NPDC004799 TaxID=3154460 RepID=UPI0033A60DCD
MQIRHLIASTAIAALTLGAAALTAPSASAQETPTYTCDLVEAPISGFNNCVASNGAPASGPFQGAYIQPRLGPFPGFSCLYGVANTPDDVICLAPEG